jgi:H+-transporting ATPase
MRLLRSCLTLVSNQSKARDILNRRHRSEKEKRAGKNDAQGASGQAAIKKSNSSDSEKQSSDEDQKDTDSDEEEENDDEDQVDKGPAICSVDQSAITGESLAVDKFHGEVVYYTTISKRGKSYARSQFNCRRLSEDDLMCS